MKKPKKRKGYAVQITSKDGTSHLATCSGGSIPFVHEKRAIARLLCKNYRDWGFSRRRTKVVPVYYWEPTIITEKKK